LPKQLICESLSKEGASESSQLPRPAGRRRWWTAEAGQGFAMRARLFRCRHASLKSG
jgi:hypothetical protein